MSNVKIREEEDEFFAYFVDSRRLIGINKVGATILEMVLNQERDMKEVVTVLSHEHRIPLGEVEKDVTQFLQNIRAELKPDGFTLVEQKQLRSPLGVELEILTGCNLRCKHCLQEHINYFMPLEQILSILDQLAEEGVCEVSLIGGEPLLHPYLLEILERCQSLGMASNIVTNATLINQTWANHLGTIRNLAVLVSLDGTEQVHDYIRGQGVFKKVDNAIGLLLEQEIVVEVMFTLNRANEGNYREVIEYCTSWGIACNFNLFKPFKSEHQDLILEPERFFEIVLDLFYLRRNDGYKIGLSNAAIVAHLMGLPPRNECRATRSGLVIDVMGRMVTCPSLVAAGFYDDMEPPKFDSSFVRTWREHSTFSEFRNSGLEECQARSLIFNGCVVAFDPYGVTAFREYLAQQER